MEKRDGLAAVSFLYYEDRYSESLTIKINNKNMSIVGKNKDWFMYCKKI